jgi:glycine cleavage system H protein
MNVPNNLKYTESNEWIEVNGNIGTIGITDFAQDQLSDIVFAEIIVAEGDEIKKGDTIATVESVKAAADIYSPASGKVVAVSESLTSTPEVINSDPYGAAWMIKVELSKPDEVNGLMDAGAYETFSASQH